MHGTQPKNLAEDHDPPRNGVKMPSVPNSCLFGIRREFVSATVVVLVLLSFNLLIGCTVEFSANRLGSQVIGGIVIGTVVAQLSLIGIYASLQRGQWSFGCPWPLYCA